MKILGIILIAIITFFAFTGFSQITTDYNDGGEPIYSSFVQMEFSINDTDKTITEVTRMGGETTSTVTYLVVGSMFLPGGVMAYEVRTASGEATIIIFGHMIKGKLFRNTYVEIFPKALRSYGMKYWGSGLINNIN